MSQAETKSSTSRRKALAAIGGIAGSALVAKSTMAAVAAANPDAGTNAALSGLDHQAILQRFQYVLDALRTRYVCEGWRGLDEAAATQAFKYFVGLAAGAPADDDEEEFAVRFICDHGQSLDWITSGDPNVMICRMASTSPRADGLAAGGNHSHS
jgi:hypothetical protein